MPATKRFMNWTGVTFTPLVGSPVTITGVTNVAINYGASFADFSGDGDRYITTKVNDMNNPTITVTAADLAALLALPPNTRGTVSATLMDAKNRTGTGAITYTVSQAVIGDSQQGAQHRQYGSGSITIGVESVDGVTNPVSTSIAA